MHVIRLCGKYVCASASQTWEIVFKRTQAHRTPNTAHMPAKMHKVGKNEKVFRRVFRTESETLTSLCAF